MAKTTKEMIEVMEWFENGGEVEYVIKGYNNWDIVENPIWDWCGFDYRKKVFQYPMWFKSDYSDLVVRFDDLQSGEVIIVGDSPHKKGIYKDNWIPHTNENWTQIEEPKEDYKQKVTIEKWLIEESNIKFVVETSNIDTWLKSFPTAKKLKLIDSYEVEF